MLIFTITDCDKNILNKEFYSIELLLVIWLWMNLQKLCHVNSMKNFSDRSDLKIYQNIYDRRREWKLLKIRSKTLKIKALKISFRRWCFWLTKMWECKNMITTVCIRIYSFTRTHKAKKMCQISQSSRLKHYWQIE